MILQEWNAHNSPPIPYRELKATFSSARLAARERPNSQAPRETPDTDVQGEERGWLDASSLFSMSCSSELASVAVAATCGEDFITKAAELARREPVAEEGGPMGALLSLARAMGGLRGGGEFFLSCRVAGRVIGRSHDLAFKLLQQATAAGWLFAFPYTGKDKRARKALTYIYLGAPGERKPLGSLPEPAGIIRP